VTAPTKFTPVPTTYKVPVPV
jgi:hypothetical protein